MVKIAHLVPGISLRIDRQTHRHTRMCSSQYFATAPAGEVNRPTTEHCLIMFGISMYPNIRRPTLICIACSFYWREALAFHQLMKFECEHPNAGPCHHRSFTMSPCVKKALVQRWLPRNTSSHFDRTAASDRKTVRRTDRRRP